MNVVAFPDPAEKGSPSPIAFPIGIVPWDPTVPLVDAVLEDAGACPAAIQAAQARAERFGSDIGDELIASGDLDPECLARSLAKALNLPFGYPDKGDRIVERPVGSDPRLLRLSTPALEARLFIAPRLETIEGVAHWIAACGNPRLVVTTHEALRCHDAHSNAEQRSEAARLSLSAERPAFSARTVLTARQRHALGFGICIIALVAYLAGPLFGTALHATLSLFLLACTLFRLLVFVDHRLRRRATAPAPDRWSQLELPIGPMPVYTVLVALYRETAMVDPLVRSLAALHWPRSKLDVKLVCEADDEATLLAATRRIADEPGFGIVAVPFSLPRTKPKALNYALPLARGEFVVLYDAEDRPDPDQLLEAWLALREGGPGLACVQAPLVIRNGGSNWLARAFAFEYAVLFRAVLPFLARYGLPIPLGGTSNHFRSDALRAVGGWDSHNVAEDADLGIRLARCGYRVGIIDAPTSEIAPERWIDWRNQRSRWVKGWMQTYLVHMREPVRTFREIGLVAMLTFQILFLSMVAGALMHTVFAAHLVFGVAALTAGLEVRLATGWLMMVDAFNIVAAAGVFALLANEVLQKDERGLLRSAWVLWLYWLLVSWASLRAVRQLFSSPHEWEKTPHEEPPDQTTSRSPLDRVNLRSYAGRPVPVSRAASSTSVDGRSPPSATSSCHSPSRS